MSRLIVYLRMTTPFHFGKKGNLEESQAVFSGDALFSALAMEWIRLFDDQAIEWLVEAGRQDQFLISDLFPFSGECLYLKKPLIEKTSSIIPEQIKQEKKAQFLTVESWISYLKDESAIEKEPEFMEADKRICLNKSNDQKPEPYFITASRIKEECGFYLMVQIAEEKITDFLMVLESLGETGIGGKKSAGLGHFQLSRCVDLEKSQLNKAESLLKTVWQKNASKMVTLSPLLPLPSELNKVRQGTYQLLKRNGFVASSTYENMPVKRKQVVMIDSGSCFNEWIDGQIIDLSENGGHPVYRYGKGFFLGVSHE